MSTSRSTVKGSRDIARVVAGAAPSARTQRALAWLALTMIWFVLEFRGMFSPGLLDDVDSVYSECAREMLARHDYVTPFVDGIRFFDKPPLMYGMAAASMKVFGVHDWAARLPLALLTLALFFAVYALGARLFGERGGLYAGLAIATSLGPYLFTRFVIPDVVLALWMTVAAHLLIYAVGLLREPVVDRGRLRLVCWAFAAVMALNVLTKGFIGLIFPVALVLLYLAATRQLRFLRRLSPITSTAVFLGLAAPWHILVALRNPAVANVPGARGWFWFYVINEHVMRFFGKRIPHDYGQLSIPLFLAMGVLWLAPWAAFLPAAITDAMRTLKARHFAGDVRSRSGLLLMLWAGLVYAFFCVSSRQEYYSLPALPALALLTGGLLARAESDGGSARRQVLAASRWIVLPCTLLVAGVAGYFAVAAPALPAGTDLAALLSSNPGRYTLSLGHIFDLTGRAMGLFHAPLAALCLAMLVAGPVSHALRVKRHHLYANLAIAGAAIVVLLCVHEGLVRFYPMLGSKSLAMKVEHARKPGDLILIDGEYTLGSSVSFYTQQPVSLVDGRINGLWFGSYWPDAPHVFETNDSLHTLWSQKDRRVFLFTLDPARRADLVHYGPVYGLATLGGKSILSNRP